MQFHVSNPTQDQVALERLEIDARRAEIQAEAVVQGKRISALQAHLQAVKEHDISKAS